MPGSNLILKLIIFIISPVILCSCKKEDIWTDLIGKNLSHWDNYLSYRHQV